MRYTAIIEMGKGESRRIHLAYDKNRGLIDLGPIKEQIPVNDGLMPVHYGYIENTINRTEKDNVDVLVFSSKSYKTGDKVEIKIIGMLTREDGDHKIIATDNSINVQSFEEISDNEQKLVLSYFGHKSKITSIDKKDAALKYLKKYSI